MQPMRDENPSHYDHLAAAGPAVDIHGRAVTANRRAAARYRQAKRAADSRLAATALRLAVHADPAFGLAVADLDAITGTAGQGPGHQQMNWERHHIEVVRAAAASNARREPGQPASWFATPPHGRARYDRRPSSSSYPALRNRKP